MIQSSRLSEGHIRTLQRSVTDSSGLWGEVTLEKTDSLESSAGRIPTLSELDDYVQGAYETSNLPFEFIRDGCQARAHLLCESLAQNGINRAKIFAYGDLKARQGFETAKWTYHVAPVVLVEMPDGEVESRVVDPAPFKRADAGGEMASQKRRPHFAAGPDQCGVDRPRTVFSP